MPAILIIDSETGGLDPAVHSLLSFGGVLWQDGAIARECEVFVLEDPLVVTPKALEVNHIDLVSHAERAKPLKKAADEFILFVEKCFPNHSKGSIVLCGHNVGNLDVPMLKRLCEAAEVTFENYFSHRSIDTMSILYYLHLLGLVPETALSSTGGFEHFGIALKPGERHTALGDARATAQLLNRMLELVRQLVNEAQPAFHS